MLVLAESSFRALDWVVIGVYFALLCASGAFFAWRSRKRASAGEYFLGGHAMPVWAVAISILATAQSAATFTGAPEQAYRGNLAYLATNLGGLIAVVILAKVFIPAYYRLGVTTPYQLLDIRFGRGAKLGSSWAYMIGRVFASGSRVYIGAIPISIAAFGDASGTHLAISIGCFMAFGIVYTLAGGITSVIWTDVLQVCVYLGAAAVAVGLLVAKIDAPWSEVVGALSAGGVDGTSKLEFLPTGFTKGSFSWTSEMNLFTICTGFVLITLASHGTDQDLVQRMLTCSSAAKGSRSVVMGLVVGIPAVALFLVLGLLLWIFYQRPELMGGESAQAPPLGGESKDLVLNYILREMPAGAAGLMIAGVMAAGPAGINSGLNSMASTFVSDVYRVWKPGRTDGHYLCVSRWAVVAWGVVVGTFGLACIGWFAAAGQSIIGFVLGVMSFAYAGLLGVFFTALFSKRGTSASAVCALGAGFVSVLLVRPELKSTWMSVAEWAPPALAFPWQLVIGTAVATMVCAVPRGASRASTIPP